MAASSQAGIYESKLKALAEEIEELNEDFAANDDGDIEFRDLHAYMMDLVKLLKLEIESSNMMVDIEIGNFLREYVDYVKTAKRLSSNKALLLPLDIQMLFSQFLKKNSSRITIVDVGAKKVPPAS